MLQFLVGFVVASTTAASVAKKSSPPRLVFDLDKDWKFLRNDSDTFQLNSTIESCNVSTLPCSSNYNDSDWRSVDVPHDFVIEGTFNETLGVKQKGYLPDGFAWYRKTFTVQVSKLRQPSLYLLFDGVMFNCAVYLNGQLIGTHDSGYVPFRIEITHHLLQAHDNNVLAIHVDSRSPDSWWYDGGGLYRHVSLVAVQDTHIAHYGVYAPSLVTGNIRTTTAETVMALADSAVVMPHVTLECRYCEPQELFATFSLYNATHDLIGHTSVKFGSSNNNATATANLTLVNASLWSTRHPALYTLETVLMNSIGYVWDVEYTTIGIRHLEWKADSGFYLNHVPTKILGTANHQDFAGVGVAVPDSLQEHRLAKIKDLGGNAWRTAHNAPNVALLDAADRMGMLVWDENHRNGQVQHAATLVKRDRNHPSIIIWSICNEALCDSTQDGTTTDGGGGSTSSEKSLRDAAAIKSVFQQYDPLGQRVVSANQNDWIRNDSVLDVLGFDYATDSYDDWHKQHPNFPAISSETSSAVSDRGEYCNNNVSGHVSDYGTEAVGWGQTTEQAWGGYGSKQGQGILTRHYIAGGFTWTGWDYKGEPTPYAWPDVNSHFGIYDIAGFAKDRAGWYQAWWPLENKDTRDERSRGDYIHLFPHWNWHVHFDDLQQQPPSHLEVCRAQSACTTRTGRVQVRVYSNAEYVELFLNDKSLGRRLMPKYGYLSWNVPYKSGNLTACSYAAKRSKQVLHQVSRLTTGPPVKLVPTVKDGVGAKGLFANGANDVALVQVQLVDAQGLLVPVHSAVEVTFVIASVGGARGRLLGTGNGDPADHTSDKSPALLAYHGLVLGIVQAVPPTPANHTTPLLRGTTNSSMLEVVVSARGFDSESLRIPIYAHNKQDQEQRRRL